MPAPSSYASVGRPTGSEGPTPYANAERRFTGRGAIARVESRSGAVGLGGRAVGVSGEWLPGGRAQFRPLFIRVVRVFSRRISSATPTPSNSPTRVPLNIIQRQLGNTNLGVTSIYLQGIDNAEIIATVHVERRR
jgi:hypothetical protein